MENSVCPHCGQLTVSPIQRLKASHWIDITCAQCGGRIAMQPIVLALLYFVHIWNVYFFGFMGIYEKSLVYFGVLVLGWLLLEFFGYYIPLVRLKKKLVKN